jgi:hypothetical protein
MAIALRISAILCVASTHILLFFFLRRFSLRPSAYLGGLCGNAYFTAERAQMRRVTQRRKLWLRLCCAAPRR